MLLPWWRSAWMILLLTCCKFPITAVWCRSKLTFWTLPPLLNIGGTAYPDRTKLGNAHFRCEADKMNGAWDIPSTYRKDRKKFVELVDRWNYNLAFKVAMINVFLILCDSFEGGTCEPTENLQAFQKCTVGCRSVFAVHSWCYYQLQRADVNPRYTTCSAPNSRWTQLETSWWTVEHLADE